MKDYQTIRNKIKLVAIEGKMNVAKYRHILEENFSQDFRMDQRFTFQQDSNPKQTTKITKEWVQNKSDHF